MIRLIREQDQPTQAELKQAFDLEDWDGDEVRDSFEASTFCQEIALLDLNPLGSDSKSKDLCKLPIRKTPDAKPNLQAVKAASSGAFSIAEVSKPSGMDNETFQKRQNAAARKLAKLWQKAFEGELPSDLKRVIPGKQA